MNTGTVDICGKEYPVIGYAKSKEMGMIPVVDIPMMDDYRWKLRCLEDRLEHPEWYAPFEDVEKVVARLRRWLAEHEEVAS